MRIFLFYKTQSVNDCVNGFTTTNKKHIIKKAQTLDKQDLSFVSRSRLELPSAAADMNQCSSLLINYLPIPDFNHFSKSIASFFNSKDLVKINFHGLYLEVQPVPN
jgi:hypothetical protein